MHENWTDWLLGGVMTAFLGVFGYLFRRVDSKADKDHVAELIDELRRDREKSEKSQARIYDKLDTTATSLGTKIDAVTAAVHQVSDRVARLEGARRE